MNVITCNNTKCERNQDRVCRKLKCDDFIQVPANREAMEELTKGLMMLILDWGKRHPTMSIAEVSGALRSVEWEIFNSRVEAYDSAKEDVEVKDSGMFA